MNSDANVNVVIIRLERAEDMANKSARLFDGAPPEFTPDHLPPDFRATVAVSPMVDVTPRGYEVLITRLDECSLSLDHLFGWCDSVEITHLDIKPYCQGLRVKLLARRMI